MIAALAIAALSASPAALDVPYLPQSDALCGGAAAAMVFRYWGDAHADPQEFAPIVDRRAGGIATTALTDAVRGRGWDATPSTGASDVVERELASGRPLIALIEDRALRYHYVVVIGQTADAYTLHDPAVGPSRSVPRDEFDRRWRATGFWALVVLPKATAEFAEPAVVAPAAPKLVENATSEGGSFAVSDMAGVRFAQRRWADAVRLAREALALDPHDAYASDVLGSSLFMQDDEIGALRAWNAIGRPRVNVVRIEGLRHARYQAIAEALALRPNMLLTADGFERARRRLEALPNRAVARLSLRPEQDGFATVDVVVLEQAGVPTTTMAWAATGARAALEREAQVAFPGPAASGDAWSLTGRWWETRPSVALAFAAPRTGALPGIWRADASWEEEHYSAGGVTTRASRASGGLTVSDWLNGRTRYALAGGVDLWNGTTKTVSVRGEIARRILGDRIAVSADAQRWFGGNGLGFHVLDARVSAVSSTRMEGLVCSGAAGARFVGAGAPMFLWAGAGDGRARPALARAHPLLDNGVVDTGESALVGRTLIDATVETRRWLEQPHLARVAVAGFVDAVRVSERAIGPASLTRVDVGAGIRAQFPGVSGEFRLDAAQGFMDRARAITVGWRYRPS